MNYVMSVDGGGSKLIAILADEHLNLVGYGVGGSVNPNFDRPETIQATIDACVDMCFEGRTGITIKTLYLSVLGSNALFMNSMRRVAQVETVLHMTECQMSLLAGLQQRAGAIALSGTGSNFLWSDGKTDHHIGGWGSLLGDEGSGYTIGQQGLMAAIQAYDGRGPKTAIQELLMEKWCLPNMWALTEKVYQAPSPRAKVASAAPLIATAARVGDEVALQIYEAAGRELAIHALAYLRMVKPQQMSNPIPTTISGGAWKGCRRMYDTFIQHLNDHADTEYSLDIRLPVFEPVMGGVIAEYLAASSDALDLEQMKKAYQKFIYRTEW